VDRALKTIRERYGSATAKMSRTVISGVMGLAARHDAVPANPVRDAGRMSSRTGHQRVLTVPELQDLRTKIAADQRAVDWDLPDFVDTMIATGLRIGETSAITWPALDLDAGTLEVQGTVIRLKGKGLVIKPKPKSEAGWRIIELPSRAVTMLKERQASAVPNQWNVVFTSPEGLLRDPSNAQADLRETFTAAGYPDITSPTFRRTVATLIDQAGLSARAAADQLGHAKVSMATDVSFGRRPASTGAAQVLEAVDDSRAGYPVPNESHGSTMGVIMVAGVAPGPGQGGRAGTGTRTRNRPITRFQERSSPCRHVTGTAVGGAAMLVTSVPCRVGCRLVTPLPLALVSNP
jgi:integrase